VSFEALYFETLYFETLYFETLYFETLYFEGGSRIQSAACGPGSVDFLAGYRTFETNASGRWGSGLGYCLGDRDFIEVRVAWSAGSPVDVTLWCCRDAVESVTASLLCFCLVFTCSSLVNGDQLFPQDVFVCCVNPFDAAATTNTKRIPLYIGCFSLGCSSHLLVCRWEIGRTE